MNHLKTSFVFQCEKLYCFGIFYFFVIIWNNHLKDKLFENNSFLKTNLSEIYYKLTNLKIIIISNYYEQCYSLFDK